MPSIATFADENDDPKRTVFESPIRQQKCSGFLGLAEIKKKNVEPIFNTTATAAAATTTAATTTAISSNTGTAITTATATDNCVSLKRKRPPKIEIPSVLREIQSDKVRPRESSRGDGAVRYDGPGVGVFSIRGKKKIMEDTHKIVRGFNGDSSKCFFGVYDGHGGRKAVDFVSENLHGNIWGMLDKDGGHLGKEEAVKAGYLKTDDEFVKQGLSSGTCCVTCLIEENDIVVSNLGDCRAVLCRGGVAESLTKDHRAGEENERKRIEQMGGYVEIHRGAWRVHGVLSVSRSIGDVHLKDWVLGEPDTKVMNMTADMEFLVLASDGLWEKVGNQEAVDTAKFVLVPNKQKSRSDILNEDDDDDGMFGCENTSPASKTRRISLVKQQKIKTQFPTQESNGHKERLATSGKLMAACEELVNLALARGSLDDITVMIIDLIHFRCNI